MLLFVGFFVISLAGMFRRGTTGDSNGGSDGGGGGGRYHGYSLVNANLDYRPDETLDYQLRQ